MKIRPILYHGLLAGILTAIAGMLYLFIYEEALLLDYSAVLNWKSITSASILGTVLASIGYAVLGKWISKERNIVFNFILLLVTFLSFYGPIAGQLPPDVQDKEFFMGAAIPMHLFPALFWLGVKPIFYRG